MPMSMLGLMTRLSFLTSWETCAMNLIEKQRTTSVSFFCDSAAHCPSNSFYSRIKAPSQTLFWREVHELPTFKPSELVFLASPDKEIVWSNKTVRKYRFGGHNDFKLVLVVTVKESRNIVELMKRYLDAMWRSGIVNSAVLLTGDSVSRIFTYFPFRNGEACEDTTPVMLGECASAAETVFEDKVSNLNKCPIRLSISDDRPWLEREPFQGKLSRLFTEIVRKMNATMETMSPMAGKNGGVCGPEEFRGAKGDVVEGRAHLAAGAFSYRECSTLEYINVPYIQCYTWCSPVCSERDYIFSFLLGLLQPPVWGFLIVAVFIVVTSFLYLPCAPNNRLPDPYILNVALLVYAQPPFLDVRWGPLRTVFGCWLFACLVIRAAFEGELKGQYAVPQGSYVIRSAEELAESNLLSCGTLGARQILKTIDDPAMQIMYQRTKECKGSMFQNIEYAAKFKDRAVFTSDLRCSVTSTELGFVQSQTYPFTGGCIKTLPFTTIVTVRGSPFREYWEDLQYRAFDSGLFKKWLDVRPVRLRAGQAKAFSIKKLLPALFVLSVGCSTGAASLIFENVFFRIFHSRK